MANLDAAFGFVAVKSPAGNVFANEYQVLGSARIFEGDLVTLNSSGYCVIATSTTGDYLGVAAADSRAAVGTSTAATILVYDDPDQIFLAQYAGSSSVTQTLVGERHAAVLNTGNTTFGTSQQEVATTTSSSYPLLIVGFDSQVDNEIGAFAKVLVKIANHQLDV